MRKSISRTSSIKRVFLALTAIIILVPCVCFKSAEDVRASSSNSLTACQAKALPNAVTGLKAAPAGKNKVQLTWNASSGAQGYLIYAQKNGSYGYVGMTSGTFFADTKALDDDYNFYFVFPYVKDSAGKIIAGKPANYVFAKGICPAVTGLKATSKVNSVQLTWNKSNTAVGYIVYGIVNGSGTYKYLGMTTQGTSFTHTGASTTEYSFYWVFPYHKNASGTMVVGMTAAYVYGKALKQTTNPTGPTNPTTTGSYVANTNSHVFHRPDCASVKRMKESNKWYYTGDRNYLIQLGYTPCDNCNP